MHDPHPVRDAPEPLDAALLPSRIGKDEMNLAEWPFAVLSSRAAPGVKTLEFSDTVRGEHNRPVKRQWIVTGSDRFGLPVAGDEDIYIALIDATKDAGFESRTVPISRYDLIERLGLPQTGPSYQRVKDALDRLAGVQIYARNAFWDRQVRKYTSVSFGILEGYVLYDEAPGRKNGQLKFKHLSSVTWSDPLFASFLAGNLKSLDLNTYFALASATARRLFRYLDKRFYDGKPTYEEDLFRLAHERLGLSRSRRYASQIREKLTPAHDELIAAGFLSRVEYRDAADGGAVVVYHRGQGRAALPTPKKTRRSDARAEGKPRTQARRKDPTTATAEAPTTLTDRLIAEGVGKATAARLARDCPGEAERQLGFLPYVPVSEIRTTRGAYLTDAIKNGYGPPAGFLKAQRDAERKARRTKAPTPATGTESPTEGDGAALEALRARLSPEELEAIEREAIETYFRRYPATRRTLGKKAEDPAILRKMAAAEVRRLLLERYPDEAGRDGS